VVRLLIACSLRLIVALSVGLSIVIGLVAVVSLALAAKGKLDLGGGYGLADVLLMSGGLMALLLAAARLGHLALGHVVGLGPRPTPRP
jgi:hypothetical protein